MGCFLRCKEAFDRGDGLIGFDGHVDFPNCVCTLGTSALALSKKPRRDYCGDSIVQERRPGAPQLRALVSRIAVSQARSKPRFESPENFASPSWRTVSFGLGLEGAAFIISANHRRHWFSAPTVVDRLRFRGSVRAGHRCKTSLRLTLTFSRCCSSPKNLSSSGIFE